MGTVATALVILGLPLVFSGPRDPLRREVLLGWNEVRSEWCAYRSSSDWRAGDYPFGGIALLYSNDRLRSIQVTATDETGDWELFDEYRLEGGSLITLTRSVRFLQWAHRDEHFSFRGGKVVRHDRVTLSNGTNQPTGEYDDEIPDFPVATSLTNFPFSNLLTKIPKDCFSDAAGSTAACVCQKGKSFP